MSANRKEDVPTSWSAASASYAERVGRMSRHACERLVSLAHATHPISPSTTYALDHGAGTGVLTSVLTARFPSTRVLATDISPGMVSAIAAQHMPNVEARVVDACVPDNQTGLGPADAFSHVFSTFMLQFTPTPRTVLREMHRVLAPGAFCGLGVWGLRIGPMTLWEEACRSIDPAYELPPYFDPSAWRTRGEVEGAMREAGFVDVRSELLSLPFEFEDSASYMRFWFTAKNPVAQRLVESFNGDLDEAKMALERVLREKYDDARSVFIDGILVTAKK